MGTLRTCQSEYHTYTIIANLLYSIFYILYYTRYITYFPIFFHYIQQNRTFSFLSMFYDSSSNLSTKRKSDDSLIKKKVDGSGSIFIEKITIIENILIGI